MEGDGRAAHGGNSAGIDAATEACLIDLLLPDAGVVRQEVLFQAPAGTGAQLTATTAVGALAGASR
jgi:hypothetical protein